MNKEGIVNILDSNNISAGTGFFVSCDGYILTCCHVLELKANRSIAIGSQVAFRFIASDIIHSASLSAIDADKDIALLHTDVAHDIYYKFQRLGCTGDRLATLGFPNRNRVGVSADPVLLDYIDNGKYIQLKEANAITHGFSGAPLVTEEGFVVGMVACILNDNNFRMNNMAFAIPSYLIIETFPQYVKVVDNIPKMVQSIPCGSLPRVLTKSGVRYEDEQSIIHRETELKTIECLLTEGKEKETLLISGMGGIGKTALACVLYSRLSNRYSSIGWVEYRGNLKMSLLASIELFEDVKDQEERWEILSKHLINDSSKVLLFIDHVDRDALQEQDPLNDETLQAISAWPNITLVLTSRFDEIPGYQPYKLECLGDEERCRDWCADLFYFFYNKEEYNKPPQDRSQTEAVRDLVKLAGYHTYAIELLAKSAKYELSLERYLKAVEESGFSFPSLNVRTNHRDAYANAAEQLRKLFDMKTRTELEKRILWDFAILPNISLTPDEVNDWLEYTPNDLDQLIAEGWLAFREGFLMPSLVKEVILLDLEDGKAPLGTASKLTQSLYNNQSDPFIPVGEAYTTIIRKLDIAENIIKYVPIQEDYISAKIYFNVGYCFFARARRRMTAISYIEKALQIYQQLDSVEPGKYIEDIAKVKFQLGYVESATHGYRAKSVTSLQEALNYFRMQEAENSGMYIVEVAKVCDHLGYVLSGIKKRREEAEGLLLEALNIRRGLAAANPSSYEAGLATTCDNLGRLLSIDYNRREEAEKLLKEALDIRQKLATDDPERHLTEVAWTYHNLGDFLAVDSSRKAEAERFYREALKIRHQLDREKPGMYIANIAWTDARLAKLLSNDRNRTSDAIALCREVLELNQKLDSEHLGVSIDKSVKECQRILNNLSHFE